jgi:hypothetical protein
MDQLTRTERRRLQRQAKKGQSQKEKNKQKRVAWIQKLFVYVIGIILVGGLGYWAYGQWTGSPGEFVPSMGNQHIGENEVGLRSYNSDPPTSGPHLNGRANWGIHENPIPKELQIHNLEDAGVAIQYNCDRTTPECKTLIDKLTQIVRRYENIILAPYPGMSHKIALTAWSRIDKFNEFDEQRIARFIDAYHGIDHHPQK